MTARPGGDRAPLAERGLRFHRRLISFLRRQRLYGTAHALERETRVFFDAARLRRMLLRDRWAAASSYALRFINLCDCTREADALHRHIVVFRIIADLAAGHILIPAVENLFQRLYDSLHAQPNGDVHRRVICTWRSDQTRASLMYHNIKPKAVDAIMCLVAKCPELIPKLARLPHCIFHPNSLGPRLWVSTTCHKKKHGRIPAHVIAASFLQKRSSLINQQNSLSSGPPLINQKTHHSALFPCVMDQAVTSSLRSARKASSDRELVAEAVSELVEVDNGVQHCQALEGECADQLRSKRVSRPNPKYYGPDWRSNQVSKVGS